MSAKLIDLGGMKGEVLEERQNKVIGRREVTLKVYHPLASTPSRVELRRRLAQRYGVDIARLYVRSVLTEYGANVSTVVVHIYESPERAKLFEPEHVIKKNGGERPEGA
ncbi:MAG: 30S ribosomal protein S24e [Acidilobaceae archaeon]|nr:30S ribosomal protein S24e [Acidilobaceae archaeon]MCX8166194.1 30S ribosomal protein S24e [Acidilobaceae archaeon]MDW7974832.1 30S ribosomal protein S24e [Sulfolobales archaeon]